MHESLCVKVSQNHFCSNTNKMQRVQCGVEEQLVTAGVSDHELLLR